MTQPVEVHVHIHHDPPAQPTPGTVIKSVEEQRYVLGVAYQAGRDERITKGMDGARDYFEPAELEKAAWSYIPNGARVNLFHNDQLEGHAQVVESYIWRGDPWVMKGDDGTEVVVKAGDWLVGAILDPIAWDLYKSDRITGWSPQGTATRRRTRSTP